MRLLPNGYQKLYNPLMVSDLCLKCPDALVANDEDGDKASSSEGECCNDCQSIRRKFEEHNLDAKLAKPYEQCQEGCRVEVLNHTCQ